MKLREMGEIDKLKKCTKCGNKKPIELYYKTIFSAELTVATDGFGNNEDVDWGGYSLLDDFLDNMLVETGKRKCIGCDKCVK